MLTATPDPVRFDLATAGKAAMALDDLSEQLRICARVADAQRAVAIEDWSGFSRDWFETNHAEVVEGLRRMARRAEADSADIRRAMQWALDEQARRDAAAASLASATNAG